MFNPRFIGVLKHPGYNGFDPLSATIATTIAAEAAAGIKPRCIEVPVA